MKIPQDAKFIPYSKVNELFIDAIEKREIKYWEDPGHGWLQVPMGLINAMKKEGMKISSFSYRDKNYGYLEHDCDVDAFVKALPDHDFKSLFNQIPREHRDNIFIRNLNRF